jgi:hypothetical protein
MADFATLHDHFRSGLTFEQARDRAGFGACSCAAAMLLARYWNLLEMDHAIEQAAVYFDRLESLA